MAATIELVRSLALALPGVEEGSCHGTPAFYVRRKLMLRLWEDGETLVVKFRREKSARPIGHAAVTASRINGDETGKILIFGAEAIADPGAHARTDESVGTGMNFQQGAAMGFVGAVD